MPYIVVDGLYDCIVINDPKTYINECCRVGHTIFILIVVVYIYYGTHESPPVNFFFKGYSNCFPKKNSRKK